MEYSFQVKYNKGPRNVHTDALYRLKTLAETTTVDRDEKFSFLFSLQHSERTKTHQGASTVVPPKLPFKQNSRVTRLQQDNGTTFNTAHLGDMAPDKLFAALPEPTFAEPMFEPIPNE